MAGYGTDLDFTDWLDSRGMTLPPGAPAPAVLRQLGSDYVDAAYEWKLSCSARTGGLDQERAWPRTGHPGIASDVIPRGWVLASYTAAYLEATQPGWTSGGSDPGRLTKREKVDVIEREFFGPNETGGGDAAPGMNFNGTINGLVSPFFCTTTRGANTLFRVI